VIDHIKEMIRDRFGVSNVPDAFIYLPETLGGLGLRNPFIPLLEARQQLEGQSPEKMIQTFFDEELKQYRDLKKNFEDDDNFEERIMRFRNNNSLRFGSKSRKEMAKYMSEGDNGDGAETFFSFEDFTRFRELSSLALGRTYTELRNVPRAVGPVLDNDVWQAMEDVAGHSNDSKVREAQWALQMYGRTLRQDFGGMRLVDDEFLPLGVLKAMRNKAVKWTMVL
jgi:hypothetical protein